MKQLTRITLDPAVMGGKACIRGLRVTVGTVVGLLAAGFTLDRRALRYTAFSLLGLSVLKVVLFDMSEVRQIYRVVSLIALGLVLVGVSYLYSRVARRPGVARGG